MPLFLKREQQGFRIAGLWLGALSMITAFALVLASGLTADDAPHLGPIANTDGASVQRIDLRYLLPAHIRSLLFVNSSECRNGL